MGCCVAGWVVFPLDGVVFVADSRSSLPTAGRVVRHLETTPGLFSETESKKAARQGE